MPVLWQPIVETTLAGLNPALGAAYTLNIITTQWIDVGILLRFQMWDGMNSPYYAAVSDNTVAEFDLIVQTAIPPGTVVIVSMRPTGTALYGYTGSETYATGGAGINPTFFRLYNSLLCFAFAPTVSGAWTPAKGRPMFAIGFNYAYVENKNQMGTGENGSGLGPGPDFGCAEPYRGDDDPRRTAPNFPDQYSGIVGEYKWTFIYEVVYPAIQRFNITPQSITDPVWECVPVPGIKYEGLITKYTAGSWTNLREIIAQPWTIFKDNYYSVSNWEWYTVLADYVLPTVVSPDVGPFEPSLMPGQLVPVYFRPRYKNINTDHSPIDTEPMRNVHSARIGMLVASPIDAGSKIYFTTNAYDATYGGFGPRKSGIGQAIFLNNLWAFQWTTPGDRVIPAGTVVVIDNIGGVGPMAVYDAHDAGADVGVVISPYGGTINNQAVVSLIALGAWAPWGVGGSRPLSASMFICAALSDQYSGDFPPLSPCLTINKDRFVGQVIYGRGRVFDNKSLPGTVQCAMINSACFTQIDYVEELDTNELPVFTGMRHFSW
jgi:hypothetical protein